MHTPRDSAAASAPGSIGNVGPGLDILGLALAGPRDEVHLTWRQDEIDVVADPGHPELPTDTHLNTASVAVRAVLNRLGIHQGVNIVVRKGLPLSGGQGGSAASATAGAAAANWLANGGLRFHEVLECALDGEAVASGRQADNLAPSLLGGLVLVRSVEPIDIIRLPVPPGLHIAIVRPEQRLETRRARTVLPAEIPREVALRQAAHVATMVAGACLGDLALFARGIDDRIAEPVRAPLLPGFAAAKAAAVHAGALGCSISGAGPTAFAIAAGEAIARRVVDAMIDAYTTNGVAASGHVTIADTAGATCW